MIAGPMRERVAIQSYTATGNGQGGDTKAWATFATVFASVKPMSGSGLEQFQTAAVRSIVSYEVEIRYRTDVTPLMRLQWTPFNGSAKNLEIGQVRIAGRDRLQLICQEAV
jgi:SPP1 family predicted phage head-tail adaptor